MSVTIDQEEFASDFVQSPWQHTYVKAETLAFFGEG